jgi:8-oxo-dGTP diphosphatase
MLVPFADWRLIALSTYSCSSSGFTIESIVMRAGAIILDNDRVVLIERFRGGNHYFVFPGGTVKKKESVEEAVVREVYEETGLDVVVNRLIAVVRQRDVEEYYYFVDIVSGVFGSGTGKEMTGRAPAERGKYEAVWRRVVDLAELNGLPQPLFAFVKKFYDEGFPEQVVVLEDHGIA